LKLSQDVVDIIFNYLVDKNVDDAKRNAGYISYFYIAKMDSIL